MKIIKEGRPYRIHKCSKCKCVYVYHNYKDKPLFSDLIYCPSCKNYLDSHLFDKKISTKKYNSLQELKGDNNE